MSPVHFLNVRFTGLTYSRGDNSTTDDIVQLEVDVQLADCPSNINGQVKKLSIGNKVANFIFIHDYDVQISRDSYELPDIVIETTINASSTRCVHFFIGFRNA